MPPDQLEVEFKKAMAEKKRKEEEEKCIQEIKNRQKKQARRVKKESERAMKREVKRKTRKRQKKKQRVGLWRMMASTGASIWRLTSRGWRRRRPC